MTPTTPTQAAEDYDRELVDIERQQRAPAVLPEFREPRQLSVEESLGSWA